MTKKISVYFFTMFLCFVIDSVIRYFLPFDFTKQSIIILPYIGVMMLTLLNNSIADSHRYMFATVTGTYYAIIYGDSLAIYVLLYCIYAFAGRRYMKLSKFSLFEALIVICLTIFVQEVVLYWLMWITNVTGITILHFVLYRLLPTLGCNLVIAVPLFHIYKKLGFEGKSDVY